MRVTHHLSQEVYESRPAHDCQSWQGPRDGADGCSCLGKSISTTKHDIGQKEGAVYLDGEPERADVAQKRHDNGRRGVTANKTIITFKLCNIFDFVAEDKPIVKGVDKPVRDTSVSITGTPCALNLVSDAESAVGKVLPTQFQTVDESLGLRVFDDWEHHEYWFNEFEVVAGDCRIKVAIISLVVIFVAIVF